MAKQLIEVVETQPWSSTLTKNVALVIGATLLMGILGRFAMPLPFTPIPLTLANFGVLLVGLTLGSRRGFAANRKTYSPRTGSVPFMRESRTGGVGCWPTLTVRRTVVSVSAATVAGLAGPASAADDAMPLVTCAGPTCRSGVALLADASWVPVQAGADATVKAAIATAIF